MINIAINHLNFIMCYKPYSVTICIVCNHLSRYKISQQSWIHFSRPSCPYQIWVASLRGLPVPLLCFQRYRHCGTFRTTPYYKNLGFIRRLSCLSHNLFFRYAQTLQASQPVLVWTFLTISCSITRTL